MGKNPGLVSFFYLNSNSLQLLATALLAVRSRLDWHEVSDHEILRVSQLWGYVGKCSQLGANRTALQQLGFGLSVAGWEDRDHTITGGKFS